MALRKFALFLSTLTVVVPVAILAIIWATTLRHIEPSNDVLFRCLLFLGSGAYVSTPLFAWLKERIERVCLSQNHPWRLAVEETAAKAGLTVNAVSFLSSSSCRPYVVAGNGVTLPSRALRSLTPQALEFLTLAALFDNTNRFILRRRLLYLGLMMSWLLLLGIVGLLTRRFAPNFYGMLPIVGSVFPQFIATTLESCPWEPQLARERFALEITNDADLAERAIRARWEMEKGRGLNPDEEARFQKYLVKVGHGWTPKAAPTLLAPIVAIPTENAPVPLRRQ